MSPKRISLFRYFLLTLAIASQPEQVFAQTTEVRDSLRGVTFYTTQISTDPKMALQIRGGLFSSSDVMTLGLSAFFFDESSSVDEYVIWLRHDGPRRWFVGDNPRPVEIHLDKRAISPAPFHHSRSVDPENTEPLIEKLEFALSPGELEEISRSDRVEVEVNTLLGTVVKVLSADEIRTISKFIDEVRERHTETRESRIDS